MRHSTDHVRPLVTLLGAVFCAGTVLAANYTLTNQSVEWPLSNARVAIEVLPAGTIILFR